MPNGKNGGKRKNRRTTEGKDKKGGRTVETAAPALFAFMGSASSSVGLSAWRSTCAPPRFGSGCARTAQRKPIIRTHPLSETGSDYMGLVRLTGVEPVRPSGHKHLKLASLPIPAQPQSAAFFRPLGYYTVIVMICQRFFQLFTGWLKQEHNWVKRQSKKQSLRKPESGGTFFISRRFSPKKWTGLDYTGRNWKGEEQHGRLVQPAGGAGNEGA